MPSSSLVDMVPNWGTGYGGMEFESRGLSPHRLTKPESNLFNSLHHPLTSTFDLPHQSPFDSLVNNNNHSVLHELQTMENGSLVKVETKFDMDSVSSSSNNHPPTPENSLSPPTGPTPTGNRRFSNERCKVCGDDATGMYFGAIVCVPCKTFFLRYAGDNFAFVCKYNKSCEITVQTRTQCKYCRYQKCLMAGMCRRERPAQVQISEGQQMCVVCSDIANGVHFGAITCEGCKKFFRRGLQEHNTYSCKNNQDCIINPRTRNSCRFCRYQKCLAAGMSREAIQMGRPAKIKPSVPKDPKPMGNDPHSPRSPSHGQFKTSPLKGPSKRKFSQSPPLPYPKKSLDMGGPDLGPLPGGGAMLPQPNHMAQPQQPCDQQSWGTHGLSNESMDKLVNDIFTHHFSPAEVKPRLSTLPMAPVGPPPTIDLSSPSPLQPQSSHVLSPNTLSPVTNSPQEDVPSITDISNSRAPCTPNQLSPSIPPSSASSEPFTPAVSLASPRPSVPDSSFMHTPKQSRVSELIDELLAQPLTALNHLNDSGVLKSDCFPCDAPQVTSSSLGAGPALPTSRHGLDAPFDSGLLQTLNTQQGEMSDVSMLLPLDGQQGPQIKKELHADQLADSTQDLLPASPDPMAVTVKNLETISNSIELPQRLPAANPAEHLFSSLIQLADQVGAADAWKDGASCSSSSTSEPSSWGEMDFERCLNYWQASNLPDENVMFEGKHLQLIDQIMPAYHRFVATGTSINKRLRHELESKLMGVYFGLESSPDPRLHTLFSKPSKADSTYHHWQIQKWLEEHSISELSAAMPQWVNTKVVPVYTLSSVTFCKDLPGFLELNPSDQCTLIRLGQSQSRILVAAVHWYNQAQGNFRDFLCWRTLSPDHEDEFKSRLVEYANIIIKQEIDTIEAALLNALVIVAIDYPGLKNTAVIEEKRMEILRAFRAYTTAKYGTPNTRIEQLFRCIPHLRQLGLLHHKMTLSQQVSDAFPLGQ